MSPVGSSREENVYMVKLSEKAEHYEEMVECMGNVAKSVEIEGAEELTVEERNLFSVAYKNAIEARWASWRIISSIEQKEESRGNEDHVAIIKDYRGKIEQELSKICDGILRLLESHLIPSSTSAKSMVFYLKMKGDYHRYLAEFKVPKSKVFYLKMKGDYHMYLVEFKAGAERKDVRTRVSCEQGRDPNPTSPMRLPRDWAYMCDAVLVWYNTFWVSKGGINKVVRAAAQSG